MRVSFKLKKKNYAFYTHTLLIFDILFLLL